MNTKVKFDGIYYQEACKYIALTSTEQQYRMGPLKRILSGRRHKNGTRPGIKGEDPLSLESGSQDQCTMEVPTYPANNTRKETCSTV